MGSEQAGGEARRNPLGDRQFAGRGGAGRESDGRRSQTASSADECPAAEIDFEFAPQVPTAVSDRLARRLQAASPRAGTSRIEVSVAGDVAILRGEVASARDRKLAELLVGFEPGIAAVKNQLVVRPADSPPPLTAAGARLTDPAPVAVSQRARSERLPTFLPKLLPAHSVARRRQEPAGLLRRHVDGHGPRRLRVLRSCRPSRIRCRRLVGSRLDAGRYAGDVAWQRPTGRPIHAERFWSSAGWGGPVLQRSGGAAPIRNCSAAAPLVPGSVTCAICDMTILPLLSSNRVSRLIRRCWPPALSQGSQKL